MCIKPPFPRQVLKDVMLFYKPGLERVSGRPIGIILLRCGMFPGEDQSRSCKCMRWYGDVWAMGAVMTGKCMAYLWVPLKRVSCTLSWMQMFPSPFNAFLPFYLIAFSFKRIVGGHCPGVVTSGDSVTHKHFTEMRRLARDETPFLLAMPPRATTLAW
jgi:hypothetical protein